jgi:putative transposase
VVRRVSPGEPKKLRQGSIVRAYRFAVDPTSAQAEMLRSHCGAQRFAFNWGLRSIRANLNQRAAELSYGVAEADLTQPLDWSAYGLRKAWNAVKDDIAPRWHENSKEAYLSGLANLAIALRNWAPSRAGDRKGRPVRCAAGPFRSGGRGLDSGL